MSYRLYLGLIEDPMYEMYSEAIQVESESIFCGDYDGEDQLSIDILFAHCFYRYAIIRVLRGDDEILDDYDRDLVTDSIYDALERYFNNVDAITEYLDMNRLTKKELAAELYEEIEVAFESERCGESVPFAMAASELMEDVDHRHTLYVSRATKIYMHIAVSPGLRPRGSIEIDYN